MEIKLNRFVGDLAWSEAHRSPCEVPESHSNLECEKRGMHGLRKVSRAVLE